MFDSIPFSSLRLFALITHFILTTGLVWTRYDSLQITLKATATRADYDSIESSYLGIISCGIISLAFEMFMVVMAPHNITLSGTLKLFLDIVGSFFVAWIILDGLEWLTYVYIFVFCVIIPTVCDITIFAVQVHKNIWVDWRRTRTIFQILWEGCEYIWSWMVYLSECVCSTTAVAAPPSAWFTSLTGCVAWVQAEGISGMFTYCWSCLASAATTSPTAMFESCWNSVTGCFTGTGEWCASLGTAFTSGPMGLMEFCTRGVDSCGSQDSMFSRVSGCVTYSWTSFSGGVSYCWTAVYSFGTEYGPVAYRALISLRDLLWSWLMWVWRQLRLFFR